MKKTGFLILSLLLVLALLAGCGVKAPEASQEPSPSQQVTPSPEATPEALGSVRLASLKGPTTMGLVKLLDDAATSKLSYTVDSTIYGTADEIQALLISGDVDMAAIPANLASVLYTKTEGKIQVAAINTLGVLSLVELGNSINSIADLSGKTVYSTGKGTTPEYMLNAVLSANKLSTGTDVIVEYRSEATEIAALLAGETAVEGTIALLPQPYATTVLLSNPKARIALDLTKEWDKAGIDGSPVTGVLVVNRDFAEKNSALVEAFLSDYSSSITWVNANNADAAELIAAAGIVPKAAVAEKALPFCNLSFIGGEDMKNTLSAYLKVLFDQNPKAVGGMMPDDNFYYGA